MTSTKSAFWHMAFAVFFVFIVLTGVHWLLENNLVYRMLPVGDYVLMTLAIFRLVRLFCYDIITKFIRDALADAKHGTFLGTLSALLSCPWCTGLWFSFFVVFFYFATPVAWLVILILALAGVGSLCQVFANLIGWHAEGKKREVLGSDHRSTFTCG
jgi:hypothetical protein